MAVRAVGRGSDPVGSVFILRIGTGPSLEAQNAPALGAVMRSSKTLASKKKQSGRKNVDWKVLDIMHPDAAGIDVGGNEHWVAVSPDRDAEPVRRCGCFTADLREMARGLMEKGVRSVAMQSTGILDA